mmetsp:Transcript_9072/g.11945  ORF Transcript_9072/g.11945 Transcript_9072/m.11945 type:complete len:113 (+) Transcript_9072:369-707(+)
MPSKATPPSAGHIVARRNKVAWALVSLGSVVLSSRGHLFITNSPQHKDISTVTTAESQVVIQVGYVENASGTFWCWDRNPTVEYLEYLEPDCNNCIFKSRSLGQVRASLGLL